MMADTSYLKGPVEDFLREWIGEKLGVSLERRKVRVGKSSDGRDVHFEFDGVSGDEEVGVCISSSRSNKIGQMRKFFIDATELNRAGFRRRIMVFCEERMWETFRKRYDGLLDISGIEPMICKDIPADMQEKIDAVVAKAKVEVGDKGRPAPPVPKSSRA